MDADEGLYQDDPASLRQCVEQTLQWDIRSHSQRAQGVDTFSVLLDGVRFRFTVDAAQAAIVVHTCALELKTTTKEQKQHEAEEEGVEGKEGAAAAADEEEQAGTETLPSKEQ